MRQINWERELIHAADEVEDAERERAVADILLLMRRFDIRPEELATCLGADGNAGQGHSRKGWGNYDPLFG